MKRRQIIIYIIIGLIIFAGLAAFILNKYFKVSADTNNWSAPSSTNIRFSQNGKIINFQRFDEMSGKIGAENHLIYIMKRLNNYQYGTEPLYLLTSDIFQTGTTTGQSVIQIRGILIKLNSSRGASFTLKNGEINYYFKKIDPNWIEQNQNTIFRSVTMDNLNLINTIVIDASAKVFTLEIQTPISSNQKIQDIINQCSDQKPKPISTLNQWPQSILDLNQKLKAKGIDLFETAYGTNNYQEALQQFINEDDGSLYATLVKNANPENYYDTARSTTVTLENQLQNAIDVRELNNQFTKDYGKTSSILSAIIGGPVGGISAVIEASILQKVMDKMKTKAAAHNMLKSLVVQYYIESYINNYLGCIGSKLDANDPEQKKILDNIQNVQTWAKSTGININDLVTTATEKENTLFSELFKEFQSIITNLMKSMMIGVWSLVSSAPL
ncbi:MAG: hypothetical protein PHW50_00220 [Patescibacteria group bacterium]|nr:hypothetical protein [Patescibacteria group bacterium]